MALPPHKKLRPVHLRKKSSNSRDSADKLKISHTPQREFSGYLLFFTIFTGRAGMLFSQKVIVLT